MQASSEAATDVVSHTAGNNGGTKFVQSEQHVTETGKEGDGLQYLNERTSLMPLVLAIGTQDQLMFEMLWEHNMLWNRPIQLVLLANIVFESQNTEIIKSFLKS